ncbi:DNA cytosine methyltransferase [Staphylococcus xylosus]|uniref:DNA cytosine methyltransferase n=1 Tax=Staphylococcus xylosus TaxID=1288 RepID=UPI003F56D758
MRPKVIDLFAGVGGMSLGFKLAGFDIVLANEIDESIANSYKYNHPETEVIVKDITKISNKDIFLKYKTKIDVVIGGPPCQGFSQKGQRKSINDDRNYLFQQFVEVMKYVQPKYFVMENVPNLLTAEKGYFKEEIISLFESIGYKLSTSILNASDFGVPQNRKRAVIIGKAREAPFIELKKIHEKVTIWDAISDLCYLESGEGMESDTYKLPFKTGYQELMRLDSDQLFNHKATKHSNLALERLRMIPPNKGRESLPDEHLTKSIYSGTWSRMRKDEQSVTITTRFDTPSSGKFTHPYLDRAITVREAARIQSFPDTFRFLGTKSSQMKQVGNAVPPLLANNIALAIKRDILKGD